MRVLLVNPLMDDRKPPVVFPLGLAYVAAELRREGHQVEVWDIDALKWSQNVVEDRIRGASFDVAGITGLLGQYRYVKWLSSTVKVHTPSAPVVLGGPLATVVPDLMLRETGADIVVRGEGEVTIKELIGCLQDGADVGLVKGIAYKRDGQVVETPPRDLMADIDDIPFPAWELFPMEVHLSHGSFGFDETTLVKSMDMITSRGCPYACIYCYHGIFGHRYRPRSVDSMIEEMKLLNHKYGVRGFVFRDDTFVVDRARVIDFCRTLVREDLGFLWACNGRVNLVDEEMLREMRRAGCIQVGYGIESGSQMIMDKINRRTTVEEAKKAIKLTWEVGMTPRTFFMMGMPWETEETVRETVEFCKEVGVMPHISFITPIPGTRLYQDTWQSGKVPDEKTLVENWENWTQRATIDLTSLGTDRLEALKRQVEAEIKHHLMKRRATLLVRRLYRHLRVFGLRSTIRKVRSWLAEAA